MIVRIMLKPFKIVGAESVTINRYCFTEKYRDFMTKLEYKLLIN